MLQFHCFSISANLAQSSKLFGTAGRMPLAMSLAMQEIWQPQVRSCLSARRSSLRWRYEPCQISVQIFPHTTIGCLGCTPHHINTYHIYIYICSDRPRIIQNNIPMAFTTTTTFSNENTNFIADINIDRNNLRESHWRSEVCATKIPDPQGKAN